MTERALVIIPTFNEVGTIEEVITKLLSVAGGRTEVLVVDDGSRDGTRDVVHRLRSSDERIHIMERAGKGGLGSAYIAGFRWGLERGYEALVEMDADLSHDPAVVPALLDALEEADLAIGSRYVPGGGVADWGVVRRALSRGGNAYACWWLRLPIADATAGFRAYRSKWLAGQDLSTVVSHGYAFQIELTRRVHRSGGTIVELPITFVERRSGASKMSKRIVIEALWEVTIWGFRDRFARSTT